MPGPVNEAASPTIVVLEGDQTGQELLIEALRVLDPSVVRVPLRFEHFDLSLENRRRTGNAVILEAAEAVRRTGLGLKAATITPAPSNGSARGGSDPDDVGSPNAILREAIDGTVILRTGRRLPNIRPVGGVHAPISVVRMAVGDAYGAKEARRPTPDGDEIAERTERISRSVCRSVAEFSFQHAERTGAKVFGGPKFTVSPVYEGMFKEELDAAAARHPTVPYEPQLIDATYALLLRSSGEAMVIPALNRDGDCLSDLVLQMYGSIAGSESLILAFDAEALRVDTVVAEAPHGTAPALQGKNIANPMAMILAGAALLTYWRRPHADRAARAIYESVFECVYQGVATPDLGGQTGTSQFTDEVIRRVTTKLDVWTTLA
ncbi:MAG TPA: isocitrate/isopropylmalate family dehydrogenase [Anaerolineales bacterium]|nr:isocitrate/isopropylmalate family dehydrogenase [Anaerolineales bacterium]